MAEIQRLERPPIIEALADFRVTLPPNFRADIFERLTGRLKVRYPKVEEMRRFGAVFQFQAGKPPEAHEQDGGVIGFKFSSEDGRDVAQFRSDGLTYNRLEPYTKWGDVKPEALRLWGLYLEVAKPSRLDKVALRYINKLVFPGRGRLNEHLAVQPPMIPGLKRTLSRFLLQMQTHDVETGYGGNVTQSLDRTPSDTASTLIFDIEAFLSGPSTSLAPDSLGSILDELRSMKNEIFFSVITEQTAQRYK